MRTGKFDAERWERARELAGQGCWLSEGARILKIHHTTALYISRKMGFKWGKCPPEYQKNKPPGGRFFARKKPVQSEPLGLPVSDEPAEYVERLMRLAGA
jgi:hypothetical protein